jgi:hypothetical protein
MHLPLLLKLKPQQQNGQNHVCGIGAEVASKTLQIQCNLYQKTEHIHGGHLSYLMQLPAFCLKTLAMVLIGLFNKQTLILPL